MKKIKQGGNESLNLVRDKEPSYAYHASEEASYPPLDPSVMPCYHTGIRIESFPISQSVHFDEVPDREKRREGVAELNHAECGGDSDESEEIWDRGCNDESE